MQSNHLGAADGFDWLYQVARYLVHCYEGVEVQLGKIHRINQPVKEMSKRFPKYGEVYPIT